MKRGGADSSLGMDFTPPSLSCGHTSTPMSVTPKQIRTPSSSTVANVTSDCNTLKDSSQLSLQNSGSASVYTPCGYNDKYTDPTVGSLLHSESSVDSFPNSSCLSRVDSHGSVAAHFCSLSSTSSETIQFRRWLSPQTCRLLATVMLGLLLALSLPSPVDGLRGGRDVVVGGAQSDSLGRVDNLPVNNLARDSRRDFQGSNNVNNVNNHVLKKSNSDNQRNNLLQDGADSVQNNNAVASERRSIAEQERLKNLAVQQKQRVEEADAKRAADIQHQLEDHEKQFAARQQQIDEREKERRARDDSLKRNKEQQWIQDLQRRDVPKEQPHQQQYQNAPNENDPVQQDSVNSNLNAKKIVYNQRQVQKDADLVPIEDLRVKQGAAGNEKLLALVKEDQDTMRDRNNNVPDNRVKYHVGESNNRDDGRQAADPVKSNDLRKVLTTRAPVRMLEPEIKVAVKAAPPRLRENEILGIPIEPPKATTARTTASPFGGRDSNHNGINELGSNLNHWNNQGNVNNALNSNQDNRNDDNANNRNNDFRSNGESFNVNDASHNDHNEIRNNFDMNNNINGQQNYRARQNQPEQPPIGGINLSWDWEDFAISFDNYGAAEMKVRRAPHATTGEPWPMPQYYNKKEMIYRVSRELKLVPTKVSCDVLEEALGRHRQRILRGAVEDMYDNLQNAEGTFVDDPAPKYQKDEYVKAPVISRVEVRVRNPCTKYPSLDSDESYDLVVKKRKTYVWANEVWGALRGLETLGQIVWKGLDGELYIKETTISDYPRFPHRGLHIDTSRHFLFKEILLDIIDSMEMNKLNVFHWHIVDDQSFPYESKVYPELSRKGAYHPTYVYTLEDIAEIIEYARIRGVRVMPEFDTPGHTYSWGLSRPELLTQCYSMDRLIKGYLGPIDPSKNATYRFLDTLFQEIIDVFQDTYLHLGGDEVPLGCWQSNPEVMAFAAELAKQPRQSSNNNNAQNYYAMSMWSDDIKRVYEYYENRLMKILSDIAQKKKKKIKYVMWQEVMNNNLQLPNDTIIQVWMGDMADVSRAISMGYQVLYSTCWYLDHIEYGTKWPKYYQCDPADTTYGYHIDESKVLGGEIAFWSEYFSNENLIPLMWPRASAGAERLWSSKEVKNLDKAAARLSEHRCRMIKRGINAGEISGPGYCLHSPPRRRVINETAGCKGGNCTGRAHNIVQIEDIELHLRQRGSTYSDCGNMLSRNNMSILIILLMGAIVLAGAGVCTLSRSQMRPHHRSRICRHRMILAVFSFVLVVYFLCYTTIWMRAFEFSGSFHKTVQEGGTGRDHGGDGDVGALE